MPRIVRFHQNGGPEVLKIEQVDAPSPGPGEVRIAVKALGLNRAESRFRSGQYLEEPKLPARLGYEAAGTVDALGDGVQGREIGDAVSTIPAFSQNQYGVYGDTALVPASAVARHPVSLSWTEAAPVWMQYGIHKRYSQRQIAPVIEKLQNRVQDLEAELAELRMNIDDPAAK